MGPLHIFPGFLRIAISQKSHLFLQPQRLGLLPNLLEQRPVTYHVQPKVYAPLPQPCRHLQRCLGMFPVNHPSRPKQPQLPLGHLVFPGHQCIRFLFPESGKISVPEPFSAIGPHQPKVPGHIGTGAEQIHPPSPVAGMVVIFFSQAPGTHKFVPSCLIQGLAVAPQGFPGTQSVLYIAFLLAAAKNHCIRLVNALLTADFILPVITDEIRFGQTLPPAHGHSFLFHGLGLHEGIASPLFPAQPIQFPAHRHLVMVHIVGDEYKIHFFPSFSMARAGPCCPAVRLLDIHQANS